MDEKETKQPAAETIDSIVKAQATEIESLKALLSESIEAIDYLKKVQVPAPAAKPGFDYEKVESIIKGVYKVDTA